MQRKFVKATVEKRPMYTERYTRVPQLNTRTTLKILSMRWKGNPCVSSRIQIASGCKKIEVFLLKEKKMRADATNEKRKEVKKDDRDDRRKREREKQGRIHGYPSRVRVGRGHN